MPLLGSGEYRELFRFGDTLTDPKELSHRTLSPKKQSQHSSTARISMNNIAAPIDDTTNTLDEYRRIRKETDQTSRSPSLNGLDANLTAPLTNINDGHVNGAALTDTPLTTAPNSPNM